MAIIIAVSVRNSRRREKNYKRYIAAIDWPSRYTVGRDVGCAVSMTLPNFLVIGTRRAGTSLFHHRILGTHPEIYVPVERKDIHYFDLYYERGVEWYQSYFPSGAAAQFRAIGEVTPDYLACPEAPRRIHDCCPSAA
jgi:hypothetical protein